MANICVSDAYCLSNSQLLIRNQNLNGRKCVRPSSVISASASRLRVLKQRKSASEVASWSFDWMVTVGGTSDYLEAVPTSVPVRVAHKLYLAGHRFLDVRTPQEFNAGHVDGAINVPYMFKIGSDMTRNPNFLKEVLLHFGRDDEIIVSHWMIADRLFHKMQESFSLCGNLSLVNF